MRTTIETRIKESIGTKCKILSDEGFLDTLERIAEGVADAIESGGKLIVCGNGGSASDSMHFVGEIVGRFQKERSSWPAVALNSDVASLTAIANDYGYDEAFRRQAMGLAKSGDYFIGISSSGNSENVLRAALACREIGCKTAALLGKTGGKIKDVVDEVLVVPNDVTARIQESHIMCIHIICEIVEERLG